MMSSAGNYDPYFQYPTTYMNESKGWVCPKCGRVYSPHTVMCFYCGNYETNATHKVGGKDESNPKV